MPERAKLHLVTAGAGQQLAVGLALEVVPSGVLLLASHTDLSHLAQRVIPRVEVVQVRLALVEPQSISH